MKRYLRIAALLALTWALGAGSLLAQDAQIRVLWLNGNGGWGVDTTSLREQITQYLDGFQGVPFRTTYVASERRGALAAHLRPGAFEVVVLDVTHTSSNFSPEDLAALKAHYTSGRRALMLDGSLWIRNSGAGPLTSFPGPGGTLGTFTVNQLKALADAGGGTLIGTDHNEYQAGANVLLQALVPGARFTGKTVPSADGVFFGNVLLAHHQPVKAADILDHWQSVPSQAEAPVGTFSDLTGAPVTLHSLVETADQPGGGVRRPYISSTIDPGDLETAIDSEIDPVGPPPVRENMPTRKGPPS